MLLYNHNFETLTNDGRSEAKPCISPIYLFCNNVLKHKQTSTDDTALIYTVVAVCYILLHILKHEAMYAQPEPELYSAETGAAVSPSLHTETDIHMYSHSFACMHTFPLTTFASLSHSGSVVTSVYPTLTQLCTPSNSINIFSGSLL